MLAAVRELGGPVEINLDAAGGRRGPCRSTRTRSTRRYDPAQVAPTSRRRPRAALVLAALPGAVPRALDAGERVVGIVRPRREPLLRPRPPMPPVDDFIMRNAMDAAGDRRRLVAGRPALRARRRSTPTPTRHRTGSRIAKLAPARRAGTQKLGEFILDWDDVRDAGNPHEPALEFGRSAVRHACAVCSWDPDLAASVNGSPPPLV